MIEKADADTLELEFLAEHTPSRFAQMHITDVVTGMKVTVDQSLDSNLAGTKKEMEHLVEDLAKIYFYWKNKPYDGSFDGIHKLKINNLLIDFGQYEGEKAWKWLIRYAKVVLDLFERQGLIDLKQIEGMLGSENNGQ